VEGRLDAQERHTASAQISAVVSGHKQLFHEQFADPSVAEAYAAELSKTLPAGVTARAHGGHLCVMPKAADSAEIARATESVENGLLLGYGKKTMLEPNDARC